MSPDGGSVYVTNAGTRMDGGGSVSQYDVAADGELSLKRPAVRPCRQQPGWHRHQSRRRLGVRGRPGRPEHPRGRLPVQRRQRRDAVRQGSSGLAGRTEPDRRDREPRVRDGAGGRAEGYRRGRRDLRPRRLGHDQRPRRRRRALRRRLPGAGHRGRPISRRAPATTSCAGAAGTTACTAAVDTIASTAAPAGTGSAVVPAGTSCAAARAATPCTCSAAAATASTAAPATTRSGPTGATRPGPASG